ncbi:MAG: bifunctional DNA-formamidopyrimidine glycosylase/DNA-(apurinic or apyrimidinic site) lyase [Burkholderiales bacterium]
MPELPEVETTRRGLEPHLKDQHVVRIEIRERRLRWLVPPELEEHARGSLIHKIERRGKYLLMQCDHGWMIVHLGMSGRLRVLPEPVPPSKHDHFDLILSSGMIVRYTDARRFGALLWTSEDPAQHPLLRNLAPEPLDDVFDAQWLHARLRGRNTPIKLAIMNNEIVTGVGNIYANEALFRAGIHPKTRAGRLSQQRCEKLVHAIRQTLLDAIEAGGSSLRDFFGTDGSPGYFQQNYMVYARQGEPCSICGTLIRAARLGQRSTFYCSRCQR